MPIAMGHINEEARRADEMSDLQQVQPSERRGGCAVDVTRLRCLFLLKLKELIE